MKDNRRLVQCRPDTMLEMLRKAVKKAGSQKKWAEANGVSAAYVNDCLHGRRDIGESISIPLGFKPMTVYVRVET